jgi:ferredoxin-NADP reductase
VTRDARLAKIDAVPALSLPIVSARNETPRNRVIRLDLGDARFDFEAGQYARLGQAGAAEPRPYSIACSPAESGRQRILEFLIQVGDDGTPGPHLPRLRAGELVSVEGPDGQFVLPTGRLGGDLLFVAGGTGIAPLRAMLWQVLDSRGGERIGLVQSGRTPEDLPYADEFRRLAREGLIHLGETVTRDAPDSWQGIRGRIGRAQLEAAMTGPQPLCYVCGPDSLVDDVPRLLAALGVPPALVYTEHWADQAARELRAEAMGAGSIERGRPGT